MAASSSTTTTHVLHHILRRQPPPHPPLLACLFTPICPTTAAKAIASNFHRTQLRYTAAAAIPLFSSLSKPFPLLSGNFSSFSPNSLSDSALSLEEETAEDEELDSGIEDGFEEDEDGIQSGSEELELKEEAVASGNGEEISKVGLSRNGVKVPNLTVKEKKELASYAHGLGKKLKSQLVGKSGVTENVVASFIETLEANELLKIKIHGTCPGELPDVVQHLEEATGSVVVSQIGRTVIIYRPSISKLKAEEKKAQNRRIFMRKGAVSLPRVLSRSSQRGRRGSSRMQPTSS